MSLPRAVAALSIVVEKGDIVLTLRSASGGVYKVALHPGIVGGITAAMIALGGRIAPKAGASGADVQPITVTSARKALGPSGQPMLNLVLEGSLHLPLTFPREAIAILKTALSELEDMTKTAPDPGQQSH